MGSMCQSLRSWGTIFVISNREMFFPRQVRPPVPN